MSFFGFDIDKQLNLISERTKNVLEEKVMTSDLHEALKANGIVFGMDFDNMARTEQLEKICNVFNINTVVDPDETYELTYDNVMKMFAIHMRFQCNIPVVIMGETGKYMTKYFFAKSVNCLKSFAHSIRESL